MEFQAVTEIRKLKLYKLWLAQDQIEIFLQASNSEKEWKEYINAAVQNHTGFSPSIDETAQERPDPFSLVMKFKSMVAEYQLMSYFNQGQSNQLPSKTEMMDLEESSNVTDYDQILIPCDDVYYSLEYDAELIDNLHMIELPQSHENETAEAKPQNQSKEDDFRSGFKYMLQIIATSATSAEIKDIKKLLTESRPSKSKWASDERLGQEQLYEELEKVLNNLKNYTEHSTPFLRPVQKREAPTYFDIIKKPMDLSLMTKKLKTFMYNSKEDFHKDLDLIWSNCLLFNVLPESIYRLHAKKMKERSDSLMKKVPEVKIRNAAELSDDEEGDSKAAEHTPPSEFNNAEDSTKTSLPDNGIDMQRSRSPSISYQETHPSGKDEADAEEPQDEQVEIQQQLMNDKNMHIKIWKTRTFHQRVKLLKERADQLQKPFGERKLLRRSDSGVNYYIQQEKMYFRRNDLRMKALLNCKHSEEDKELFMNYNLPELFISNSVPESSYKIHSSGDLASFYYDETSNAPYIPPAPLPSLSEYSEFIIDTTSPLNNGIKIILIF